MYYCNDCKKFEVLSSTNLADQERLWLVSGCFHRETQKAVVSSGGLDLSGVTASIMQQTFWAFPYHGAGFGEVLVGPRCSQRGQTGMAGPLLFRCLGSSYWALLAQLKDWNRLNLGNGTGGSWGQKDWLSGVLFGSKKGTDSRSLVYGRIEGKQRHHLIYSVLSLQGALLKKLRVRWSQCLLVCPSPLHWCPPSPFLANVKSSRTPIFFFSQAIE